MNLINEQVVHRTFGVGYVVSVDNARITIQFSENIGQKMFSYPYSFEQYLNMCNPLTQEFVAGELKKKLEMIAAERASKEQERLEEANRRAAEKAVLRKTVAKKPKRTKTTKKA